MNFAINQASTLRFIEALGFGHAVDEGSYEYLTSALWMNIVSTAFPLNTVSDHVYAPEYVRNGGRCDLVVSQSDAGFNKPYNWTGQPFLAVEFKTSNATDKDWDTGAKQLRDTMMYLAQNKPNGPRVKGILAGGTEFMTATFDSNGTFNFTAPGDLFDPGHANNLSPEGLAQLQTFLGTAWASRPVNK